jgi:integrase
MPVYRGRTGGTWSVVIWCRGKRHERIIRGRRKAALEHEAVWRLELGAHDPAAERAGLLLEQLCARYLIARRATLRAETWRVQRSQLATVCTTLGDVRSSDMTTARVEDFKAARAMATRRTTKRDTGVTVRRSTVNNELRALGRVLSWAREMGYRVPEAKVKRLRQDAPRVRAFTAAEMDRLYGAARALSPQFLAMLIWLANTGMRRGELLAAEWSWLDFERDVISIPCSVDWGPKSRRAREVPLEPIVKAAIAPLRKDGGPVFRTRTDGRYHDWPKDWWIPARNAAGLRGGVHQLRHTYATHYLAAGGKLSTLAAILGQSLVRTTELYAHMLPGYWDEARGVVRLAPTLGTVAEPVAVDRMAHRRRAKAR